MYAQSDEERVHMLKVMKFINERMSSNRIKSAKTNYETFQEMFEELYKHEVFVSNAINELVHIALTEKVMHTTFTMVRRRTN
jgi:ferritin